MRALLLLATLSLAAAAFALAPAADATAFCTDKLTDSCRSLACVPDGQGHQVCSEDLSPRCFTEPCPGIP